MAIRISGTTGIDMGNTSVSNASQVELQEEQVTPFSGFKNYIINGKKVINQRALTSTDNSYNQDRWYKVGNNWFQGIEGDNNLISGKKYTLSWVGNATASYYVGTDTSATINAQTFTPIINGGNFTLTISAGQNLWIKFASDSTGSTFNFVQLEEGTIATPFENRPYGLELSLCQRYLPSFNGRSYLTVGGVCSAASKKSYVIFKFNTPTRVPPTGITYSSLSAFNFSDTVTINEGISSLSFWAGNQNLASVTVVNNTIDTVAGRPAFLIGNSSNATILFTGCEL